MIVHLNHVIRFTFSQCQGYNRLKCSVTKIVSAFCVCLLFEIYKKKPMHSTIIQVHKLSSYLKKIIIPVIFIDTFPLLFAIFRNFVLSIYHFLPISRYSLLFSTIFCRFTLLTDFPLYSLLFSTNFLSFYSFNRFSTIFLPIFHIILLLNLQRTHFLFLCFRL